MIDGIVEFGRTPCVLELPRGAGSRGLGSAKDYRIESDQRGKSQVW
jgi:hypothetical protein